MSGRGILNVQDLGDYSSIPSPGRLPAWKVLHGTGHLERIFLSFPCWLYLLHLPSTQIHIRADGKVITGWSVISALSLPSALKYFVESRTSPKGLSTMAWQEYLDFLRKRTPLTPHLCAGAWAHSHNNPWSVLWKNEKLNHFGCSQLFFSAVRGAAGNYFHIMVNFCCLPPP